LHNSSVGFFSLPTYPSVIISRFEEKGDIPKVGDIWIPKGYTPPNCFTRFFIPRVEKLLQEGNRILRVQAGGDMFKLINWRLCVKSSQGFKWQLKSSNDHAYVVQSSNLLNPMVEGR
jgi:hypothetical protein